MKKTGKKLPKKKNAVIPELHAWVAPLTQAHYWAGMIGEVVAKVGGTKKDPMLRVRFAYMRDGRKKLPEEFDFPASRLKVVPDFKARLKKHAPAKADNSQDPDFTMFDAEEVPSNISGLVAGDKIKLTQDTKTPTGELLNKGMLGFVVETFENGEHLAVEFPVPGSNLHLFKKMHHSYATKVVEAPSAPPVENKQAQA